jgi:hypothetical protein
MLHICDTRRQPWRGEGIRSLVDAIILVPENGILRVEVRGELAAILALTAEGKEPGRTDRLLPSKLRWLRG